MRRSFPSLSLATPTLVALAQQPAPVRLQDLVVEWIQRQGGFGRRSGPEPGRGQR
jgi:hypothetical protein